MATSTPNMSGITWDAAPTQPSQPSQAAQPDANGITWDTQPTPVPSTPVRPPSSLDLAHIAEAGLPDESQVAIGAVKGLGDTVNGLGHLVRKVTGAPIPDESKYLDSASPIESAGKGIESVLEFMGGDAALKGLGLADRLSTAGKVAKVLEEHPTLAKLATAGVAALRNGAVGAAQGGLKTGTGTGAVAEGLGGAVAGGLSDAASGVASTVGDRIGTVVSGRGAIQDTLQDAIRKAVNDTATDAGVAPSNAASIRDTAQEVSDNLIAKAKADYQALDKATGGRAQRFTDAIRNIQNKLRDVAGLDSDVEGSYIEKLNDAQDAHEAAMKEAEDAGLPKGLIDRANASFKQGKAMSELSAQIRQSAEGMRPEMADAARRPTPESVNAKKLNPKLDRMINSGRMQQAIGDARTKALRAAANDAEADTGTVQAVKNLAKRYAPYVGLYGLLHHFMGHAEVPE